MEDVSNASTRFRIIIDREREASKEVGVLTTKNIFLKESVESFSRSQSVAFLKNVVLVVVGVVVAWLCFHAITFDLDACREYYCSMLQKVNFFELKKG